jgi:hypothetical protein
MDSRDSGRFLRRVEAAAVAALALAASVAVAGDFRVETATYLGGPAVAEEWNAIAVAPDGAVVVAGRLPDTNPGGVKAAWLLGGGDGVVLRLGPAGTNVLSIARIGDHVDDLDVDETGRIAVCGSFGVALLATNGQQLLWRDGSTIRGAKAAGFANQTPPFKVDHYRKRVSRVASGADGVVASIQAEEKEWGPGPKKGVLYAWASDGRRLCEVRLTDYKYPEDLVVAAREKLIIVGGFNTYAADSPHMKNHPIHMQFLTAYDYDGQVRWKSYDFPAAAVYAQNTYADCRVQRLAIGRDGLLYMGGYIHGGDYVWRHDPHDVTRRVQTDVGYDSYSTAGNMGRGIDHAYFARFDPSNGTILASQPLLCRQKPDGGGKPSQIQIKGIAADERGNVYLAGYCEAYIKNRDAGVVQGETVGPYHKPEAFLLVVSPDFRTRRAWTVFSRDRAESAAWGVAVRGPTAALIGEVYEGSMIATTNALQPSSARPFDGYLVTWRAQTE